MIKNLLYTEAVYKHKINVGSNNAMEDNFKIIILQRRFQVIKSSVYIQPKLFGIVL